jgi:hypothetical protein
VGEHAGRRVGLGLGQAEQLLCELVRRLHLSSRQIIRHQPPQHRKELRGVAHLLTQLAGTGVGVRHVGGALSLDRHQGWTESDLQIQLTLGVFGALWQGLQDVQPSRQMFDRFHIGRALQGALACLLPIGDGLRHQAGLHIMMGQEFGLGLTEVGKACLQYLGNALMVLLPHAPQQGLIGCFLNQGMLKEVCRLRRQTLLVQQLCFDQLVQPPAQGALVP